MTLEISAARISMLLLSLSPTADAVSLSSG
jgi:hypothetical protein